MSPTTTSPEANLMICEPDTLRLQHVCCDIVKPVENEDQGWCYGRCCIIQLRYADAGETCAEEARRLRVKEMY